MVPFYYVSGIGLKIYTYHLLISITIASIGMISIPTFQMMKLSLKNFKELFQVMDIDHQISVIWPSYKDNIDMSLFL